MEYAISSKNGCDSGLSSNLIKLIAVAAMTIDHAAWLFFPGYNTAWYVLLFHAIGRITAPIMWYFVAEGFFHTRNIKKYACRLLILAVISHFAYNFFNSRSFIPFKDSYYSQTSIIWGLFCGLMLLIVCTNEKIPSSVKLLTMILIGILAFPSDWTSVSSFAILFMGLSHNSKRKQMAILGFMLVLFSVMYCINLDFIYGILQLCSLLSIPILLFYNGKRGKTKGMKWFFYIYYPLHMVILKFIQIAFVKG